MYVAWLGVASLFAWTHLVWRDEVRALSLALQDKTVFAMFQRLHGRGHPALWYLLLRAAHTVFPHPEVLLVVSMVVAAGAMLILMLRAPFSLPILGLILIAGFSTYNYSVVARNYGISMLLLFLFANLYEQHRDRGCLLGVLLFLLANCNVHSALLAGGLLLFWLVDLLRGEAASRAQNIHIFLWNAALVALGVATCFITVFPIFDDAATIDRQAITLKTIMKGVFLPAQQFVDSCRIPDERRWLAVLPQPAGDLLKGVKSLVLFGSTLGLIRRTAAFIAALASLVGMSLFFVLFSLGSYRHQALWLVFLICMYWLMAPGSAQRKPVTCPTRVAHRAAVDRRYCAVCVGFASPVAVRRSGSHKTAGLPDSNGREPR